MIEVYAWVPWFAELCRKIVDGNESDLAQRAHQVQWKADGAPPALLDYGDENVDPFSFLYTLATGCRYPATRRRLHDNVNTAFGLSTTLPVESDDAFIFPQGIPFNTLFHKEGEGDPALLWRLFRSALRSADSVDSDAFRAALAIGNVRLPKLTQTLFLINPTHYMPLDDGTRKLLADPAAKVDDWSDYQAVLSEFHDSFPGCALYEVNLFAWLLHSGNLSVRHPVYQVSTNVYDDKEDRWEEFVRENAVWTGGPGTVGWDDYTPGAPLDAAYPLTLPEPGDLMLVRYASHGRGIGIVHRNDYATELSAQARLHVVWLNRSNVPDLLPASRGRGFSRAHANAETFFAHDAYRPTHRLLHRLRDDADTPPADAVDDPAATDRLNPGTPLNQILYGPPGTGKTWRTVDLAVSIVDNAVNAGHDVDRFGELRFDPVSHTGNIALVTFHQNFAYEDFVQGIRPVLDASDLRYELRDGLFKRIAEAARDRPSERFVLIVDEINRGNIAKIFGELITLIEESRRMGEPEQTFVTLPYSGESFGVPRNLYLIGTMNTADRSIQLLDTALRRRFTFRECMPEPDHPGVPDDLGGVDCRHLLRTLNERIAMLMDREHQIGHTYFLGLRDLNELADAFRDRVFPLLQEYFFDDWAKIRAVLANNAFVAERSPQIPFPTPDLADEGHKIYERLPEDDDRWRSADQYRAVYRPAARTADDDS